ncbi:MAG: hypothetical protein IT431_17520 [Phycisphaerales bacterium]|nr:hypothetical protein [Phycisphaerales bacterium]
MPKAKAPQPRPLSFHLAMGVALVCLLAVAFIVFRAVTAPPAAGPASRDDAFATGTDEGVLGQDSGARGLHIQIMDREAKNRLSAELMSDTIDPLQAQRYQVTQPRATVYLEDGRVIHITARGGTLVMPDRAKAPETGTLTDDVVVRLFNRRVDGSAPVIEADEPAFTWTGRSLTFDSTLGEASTDEPFVLASREFEFSAKDAKLLINQALERLERFTVRQGGTLVYTDRPDEQAPTPPPAGTATAGAGAAPERGGAADPGLPPPPPVTTYYQAAMRDGIVLTRAGQEVRSDRMDVFARTIDSRLPPGAIAEFRTGPVEPDGDAAEGADGAPAGLGQGAPAGSAGDGVTGQAGAPPDSTLTPPAPTEATAPEEDGPTTLTWTGVLEVRPLSAEPPELAKNHLLARFTSEESGVVTFADAASEASGRAAVVEYGFTGAELVLSGPSQGRSVLVSSPSMGEASMGRFELPLKTGEATIPGPFTVIGADGISRIDSGERARLLFAVEDGRLTGQLLEAEFIGTAKAADADASLEANRLLATFEPDADGRSQLARLVAVESVRLADGKGATGWCDMLDTRFARGADQPTPESFTAEGNASFRDQTARVDAQHLHAILRATESGGIEVAKAWAEGAVEFRRHGDRIAINGERLFADTDAQYLEVESDAGQASVARGPTRIAGSSVRLNGLERTAFVQGVGSFEHRAGKGDQASRVFAGWTEGMAFDDLDGKLEAVGAVEADHEPDAFTREHISASVLRVELEPGTPGEEVLATDEPAEPTASETDRPIRTVYAAGREPREGEEPDDAWRLARVESARYVAPLEAVDAAIEKGSEAQPALERAFRLSGTEILADNTAGTLDVPGRGRLVIADLRPQPEGEPSEERGAALFDWSGSLHADRNAGEAQMVQGVQMVHHRTLDGTRTVLDCQWLKVRFTPGEGAAGAEPESLFGGLRSAIAETQVYLRTDAREMTASLLEYNPDTGIARAVGESFDGVRILDRRTGSPMTASAMIWDLTTDRVDIVDPSTITIIR